MTTPCLQLDGLPREIIAHVASNTDAPTILSLSSANRALRLACYDPVVFRTILELSQTRTWPKPFVDVHAIAARAQLDVRCWARYAVAEHAAAIASQDEAFRQASNILRWLPELLIVLHPDAKSCLYWIYDIRRSQNVSSGEEQLLSFCLAFAELARVENRPRAPRAELLEFITYGRSRPTDLVVENSMVTCHITLLQMAKAVRWDTVARRSPWPLRSDTVVLRMNLPHFSAVILRLRPGAEGTLPLPLRTYHHPTTGRIHASSEWLDWYALQSQSLLRSGGTWCGYYSYGSSISDPPMVKIEFSIEDRTNESSSELRAEQCSDGYGTFCISGDVDWEKLSFRGSKRYTSSFGYGNVNGVRWLWDLKLTLFGLIGDWRDDSEIARQHGYVWLWKEDWSI